MPRGRKQWQGPTCATCEQSVYGSPSAAEPDCDICKKNGRVVRFDSGPCWAEHLEKVHPGLDYLGNPRPTKQQPAPAAADNAGMEADAGVALALHDCTTREDAVARVLCAAASFAHGVGHRQLRNRLVERASRVLSVRP